MKEETSTVNVSVVRVSEPEEYTKPPWKTPNEDNCNACFESMKKYENTDSKGYQSRLES